MTERPVSATDGWRWVALAFAVLAVPLSFDMAEDAGEGVPLRHLLFECFSVLVAASGLGLAMWKLAAGRAWARQAAEAAEARASSSSAETATAQAAAAVASEAAAAAREEAFNAQAEADAARRAAVTLNSALEAERLRADAEAFRANTRTATTAISAAIAAQLTAWGLTPAELEVARLLLLGLSHKEIAGARETSERTARDQAQAVYKKAAVAGRAELSAFFLEDLLPVVGGPS